jgi:hypothetical protein
MATIKQLLDLASSLRALVLWLIELEKKYEARKAVDATRSGNTEPVEHALNGTSLGHTTADLPSVRIEPKKDRTRRGVED